MALVETLKRKKNTVLLLSKKLVRPQRKPANRKLLSNPATQKLIRNPVALKVTRLPLLQKIVKKYEPLVMKLRATRSAQ